MVDTHIHIPQGTAAPELHTEDGKVSSEVGLSLTQDDNPIPPQQEVISRSRETTGCETNTNKDIITPKRKHWNKLTSGTDIPVRKDEDSLPSTVPSQDSDLSSPPFDSPSPEKEDGASAAKVLLPLLGEPSPAKQPTKKMRGGNFQTHLLFSW